MAFQLQNILLANILCICYKCLNIFILVLFKGFLLVKMPLSIIKLDRYLAYHALKSKDNIHAMVWRYVLVLVSHWLWGRWSKHPYGNPAYPLGGNLISSGICSLCNSCIIQRTKSVLGYDFSLCLTHALCYYQQLINDKYSTISLLQ